MSNETPTYVGKNFYVGLRHRCCMKLPNGYLGTRGGRFIELDAVADHHPCGYISVGWPPLLATHTTVDLGNLEAPRQVRCTAHINVKQVTK